MDYRVRYRSQTRPRSALAEWIPFVLAIVASAALLFMLAKQSPVFSTPAPLETGQVHSGGGGGGDHGGGGGGGAQPE